MLYAKTTIRLVIVSIAIFSCIGLSKAQCTSGNIIIAHSNSIYDNLLDPNSDSYITESGGAFTGGTSELAEFEIIPNSTTGWIEIQDVNEIDSDITPNCGNSDLIQDNDGGDFAYYNIIDPTPGIPSNGDEFILLRFRLSQSPNGNFGYNFLVDTDAAYGAGIDPNSLCGNNGFEREVQFANAGGKKGVSVYDVDGSTSFNSTLCNQCIDVLDVQEACAASSGNCGTTDPQFITFPLPLSYLNVPSNTSVSDFFISVATASSGNATSVLGGGNVTDMGALDGANTGCACTGLSGCNLFDCQTNCIHVAFDNLPVDLLYFSVSKDEKQSLLKWATASEINNSHFVIEHSVNGISFKELAIIEGAGSSTNTIEYSFLHQTPQETINYYRIKQIDFNGDYSFSPIKTASFFSQKNKVTISPSITRNRIQIRTYNPQIGEATIEVFNLIGRKIDEFKINTSNGYTELNVSQYQSGHYFLKVKMGSVIFTKRFIKS